MNRTEVETLLAGHEHVARVLVLPAADPASADVGGGTAYVVPEPGATGDTEPDETVDEWRQVFNRVYTDAPQAAWGENFVGWTSGYDRHPIAPDEMREWRDTTVTRIRGLGPRRVLEIGAGSGLLLSQLAGESEEYWATDVSPAAIGELAEHIARHPRIAERTTLRAQPADSAEGLPTGFFDTVVINSVSQFFPDEGYLCDVIDRALPLLAAGGRIFIGDIRDPRSAPLLHTAAALRRPTARDGARALRSAERTLAREEELFIHPDFFLRLARTRAGLVGADLRLKAGGYHNELSRHRYDAVLHAAGGPEPVDTSGLPVLRWGKDLNGFDSLTSRLQNSPQPVRVTGIPNARLAGEAEARHALESGAGLEEARRLLDAPASGVDPQALDRLAERIGCRAALTPSPGDPFRFEAVFTPSTQDGAWLGGTYRAEFPDDHDGTLAEVPATALRARSLAERLQRWLQERLPGGDAPTVVVRDSLPQVPDAGSAARPSAGGRRLEEVSR
ncbi:class I SAM-dependent methyltransferase [Nocardiopsis halophila]|uniref:class I SAM-dependent methyltransferase n=1 Tax=Nocardiopsis halophila TaxID=141692 RepID=UPI0003476E3D|nr:class I SAM-dependent methyltransferase [Nocardiopsis halophila]